MKPKMKLKFVAAGAALCALGMTGCSNETDEAGAQAGKQVVMTMQSATDVPQTRADYTEDGTDKMKMNFSWRNGDNMSVVVDGVASNENCKLTTTEAGKSAPFSGTVTTWTGTKDIYAFYPYNNSTTPYVVTGGDNKETATATLTLPPTQSYTIGGAISNSFMVGVGTATATADKAINASVSMKQVMSIIKLNITNAPAKVTGVKLKCADAVFATTATVTLSDATITNPGTLVKELSMTVTDLSTDHAVAKAISFAMFPTDLTGKKVQVEVTFEGGTSKTIEKDGTDFERNMHYVMAFDGAPAITWAAGNLVADGANGAKIGTATDGGLYFQFGSLVGWSTEDPLVVVAKPAAFNGKEGWAETGKIWQGTTGVVPFTATGSDDEKAGIGDPCRYYLKDTWRLPTKDEYVALFKDGGYPSGTWKWENSSATNSTKNLTFPASGFRDDYDGSLHSVGGGGYYWSASPYNASNGYILGFNKSGVSPSNNYSDRAIGLPVRCVQNASN